jgi:predicted HNH restriction endonuclease
MAITDSRITRRKHYDKCKDLGLCISCGEKCGKIRCKKCADKFNAYSRKNVRNNKLKVLEYFGNVCSICGFKSEVLDVFDVHHKNPKDKEIEIAYLLKTKRDFNRILDEVKKCILVCSNCHRIIHYQLRNNK